MAITATGPYVPGEGPVPCRVMLVGEAPGETEAQQLRPFVGRAGREQDTLLNKNGLARTNVYITNLIKRHIPNDADPTPDDIALFGSELQEEIRRVNPKFIIAVGRYAVRWFLGDVDMEDVHGIPHRYPGWCRITILPCYHPAYGFYSPEAWAWIAYDYRRAVQAIRGEIALSPPIDALHPIYIDAGPDDLREIPSVEVAIDTEGLPSDPWGLSFSCGPGHAFVLRRSRPDFKCSIERLRHRIKGCRVALHNAMWDLAPLRAMGLDLSNHVIFDTMVAAYLLRVEPQGLKPLARRWCGMRTRSYKEVTGGAARDKQIEYLSEVLEYSWPKPEPRAVVANDLSSRMYTPQSVDRRVIAILGDVLADGADLEARWGKVDSELRQQVEAKLGPLPQATLDDIPLGEAVYYSGRDADATLRLAPILRSALVAEDLISLMDLKMKVLPVFEQMQANGMPADRAHFEWLSGEMGRKMEELCSRLSHRFNRDRPINPASGDQVAKLMRRRGLQGEKRTGTGKMSTGKKSIEHLRYTDEAIALVVDWREHQKIRDSFANPILDRFPPGADYHWIRGQIKITRTESGRISMVDPNLTAIPVRNEIGVLVRKGFVAPEGWLLGSWDLNQIEMRVMAHLSKDPTLCKMFINKRDVHAETAAKIFGVKLEDVHPKKHRYPAKRAGFGVITGIEAVGLLDQLRMFGCEGWDESSCRRLINEWLKMYKGVREFMLRCRHEAGSCGAVRDMGGMIRYLPMARSGDKWLRLEAERQSHSHKIQGSAQWMLQRSMAWLAPKIAAMGEVRWLLQIHDELILAFKDHLWDTVDPIVRAGMTDHSFRLSVPVEASGTYGKTWGDLKD